MNALTRFDRIEDFLPAMFQRFARPFALSDMAPGDITLDITENDKDYQVRAAIPGAKKDDIRVSVDGNLVSISVEVKQDKEENATPATGPEAQALRHNLASIW